MARQSLALAIRIATWLVGRRSAEPQIFAALPLVCVIVRAASAAADDRGYSKEEKAEDSQRSDTSTGRTGLATHVPP